MFKFLSDFFNSVLTIFGQTVQIKIAVSAVAFFISSIFTLFFGIFSYFLYYYSELVSKHSITIKELHATNVALMEQNNNLQAQLYALGEKMTEAKIAIALAQNTQSLSNLNVDTYWLTTKWIWVGVGVTLLVGAAVCILAFSGGQAASNAEVIVERIPHMLEESNRCIIQNTAEHTSQILSALHESTIYIVCNNESLLNARLSQFNQDNTWNMAFDINPGLSQGLIDNVASSTTDAVSNTALVVANSKGSELIASLFYAPI